MRGRASERSLGQKQPAVIHLVLQAGGELVDVGGRNVTSRAILKERRPVAAYGIATNLQKQSVYRIRINFCGVRRTISFNVLPSERRSR